MATLRLLVIFLGFCNLLCLNAVPTTRSLSLMGRGPHFLQVSSNTHMVITTAEKMEVEVSHGRMFVELNDYPGSGANNRHTPRPQFSRGCTDC